jgi:hypothetical protein
MDLGVVQGSSNPLGVHCDNNGAIAQVKEPRKYQKNKHIMWPFHILQEPIDRGEIKICKIHTYLNISDPLTKPLP